METIGRCFHPKSGKFCTLFDNLQAELAELRAKFETAEARASVLENQRDSWMQSNTQQAERTDAAEAKLESLGKQKPVLQVGSPSLFWLVDERPPCGARLYAEPKPADGEIVVTTTEDGQIVAVTRQDSDGRILEVIAESKPAAIPEARPNTLRFTISFKDKHWSQLISLNQLSNDVRGAGRLLGGEVAKAYAMLAAAQKGGE